ncbi:fatty acid desaturase [Neptunicoccus sediminis]|uniref:fatty acid desaturase n=1 Tax=Neptunicoccus sediminis TaxID=1892596 RepID=UPI000845E9E7|nr:fatty acid desaturase [Neptunicoccus sediminis]
MDTPKRADAQQPSDKSARDWAQSLAQYRKPNTPRAIYELAASLLPFIGLWALAWWMIPHSAVLAVLIAIINGGFLVRLFAIQHDCGHGAFVKNAKASNWIGRCLGVLTLTPYAVWRKSHSHHHSTSGNLDHRGMGDVHTKTVAEYAELNRWQKLGYRLYRSPFVLFGLGPVYLFVLQNRLPIGLMTAGRVYWISAMGTNAVLALLLGLIAYFGGIWPLLLVFAPTVMTAAAAGVWLFYVQHQFEETHWDRDDAWNIQDAAFHGSSYYKLPALLNWLTAYIGVHHVHHLNCRIPFYRLPEVLSDHTRLAHIQIITLAESFHCARLHLWDEDQRRLLSFAHANKLIAAQRPT